MKSKLYYGIRCYKRYMTHTDIKYILCSLFKEVNNLWIKFYSLCHSWFGKTGKFQKLIVSCFFISFLLFCVSIGMGNLATATPVYASLKSFVDNLPTTAPDFYAIIISPRTSIILGIIAFISFFLLLLGRFSKPLAYRIIHNSMDPDNLAPLDFSISKKYKVVPIKIDLYDFLNTKQISKETVCKAITSQTQIIDDFKRNYIDNTLIFYTGIAHTPFIFLAGAMIGDRFSKVTALHKKVGSTNFEELPTITETKMYKRPHFKSHLVDFRETGNGDQLLAIIQTSFQICSQDTECFNSKVAWEMKFSFENDEILERDSIDTAQLQTEWCEYFWYHLRSECKAKSIKTVHLVISSSSDLTFLLGQGYKNTYDPEIIVYHYCRNATPPYPWGLRIGSDVSYVSNS